NLYTPAACCNIPHFRCRPPRHNSLCAFLLHQNLRLTAPPETLSHLRPCHLPHSSLPAAFPRDRPHLPESSPPRRLPEAYDRSQRRHIPCIPHKPRLKRKTG